MPALAMNSRRLRSTMSARPPPSCPEPSSARWTLSAFEESTSPAIATTVAVALCETAISASSVTSILSVWVLAASERLGREPGSSGPSHDVGEPSGHALARLEQTPVLRLSG
jgi:hypothetical protein